jgi:tellurite resistance protein
MRDVVVKAIGDLCDAFERSGYSPTPIIDLAVLVASAEGAIDDRERAMLLDLLQTLLGTNLTAEVVDHLITASLEVIEVAGAKSRARLVASILDDCDAVEPALRVGLAVAFASEGLSAAESAVLEDIADAAKFPRARLGELAAEMRLRVDGDPMSVRQSLSPARKPAS